MKRSAARDHHPTPLLSCLLCPSDSRDARDARREGLPLCGALRVLCACAFLHFSTPRVGSVYPVPRAASGGGSLDRPATIVLSDSRSGPHCCGGCIPLRNDPCPPNVTVSLVPSLFACVSFINKSVIREGLSFARDLPDHFPFPMALTSSSSSDTEMLYSCQCLALLRCCRQGIWPCPCRRACQTAVPVGNRCRARL